MTRQTILQGPEPTNKGQPGPEGQGINLWRIQLGLGAARRRNGIIGGFNSQKPPRSSQYFKARRAGYPNVSPARKGWESSKPVILRENLPRV
jgi:hypothetical protein